MTRNSMGYPSDISEQDWEAIKHYFEAKDRRGNRHIHEKRTIVNAIRYVLEGGIKWRMLPKDFPPWQTVYDHFNQWNKKGVWEVALKAMNKVHRKKKPEVNFLAMASLIPKVSKHSTPAKKEV